MSAFPPPTMAQQQVSPSNTVQFESMAYRRMLAHWELIDDLMGGTIRMRAASTRWLPKEVKEEDSMYQARLGRSVLYEAFSDTVSSLGSKPFSRPITIEGELPERLQSMVDNADLKGTRLTQFGRQVFNEAIARGLCHILTDFPQVSEAQNLKQELDSGVRPYFVKISARDMLGWKFTYIGNVPVLSEIRFREVRVVPDGEFGECECEFIRIYRRDGWELHKLQDANNYVFDSDGPNSLGEIPLATVYTSEKKGELEAYPPLEKLAWLNLAHWQSTSQQKNCLHFARVPMIKMSGCSPSELDKETVIAPNRVFKSTSEKFDMGWVEHTGKSIEAGQADIDHLEAQMEVMGLQPLMKRTGNTTATSRALDTSATTSDIQEWIRNLESALMLSFGFAAKWIKATLPTEGEKKFSIQIFNDFGITLRDVNDVKELLAMRIAREIDRKTFIMEIKRRGTLSETTDPQVVMDALDAEPPPPELQAKLDNPGSAPSPNRRPKNNKGSVYKNRGKGNENA